MTCESYPFAQRQVFRASLDIKGWLCHNRQKIGKSMPTIAAKSINVLFDSERFSPDDHDRMFVYIWEDQDDREKPICKFGQRLVKSGKCPVDECAHRIYGSLGVRKDRARLDKKIDLIWIFDVTALAKKENRFSSSGKIDDWIRSKIGFARSSTGETHMLSGQEMKVKVADVIKRSGETLIDAYLSTIQRQIIDDTIAAFQSDKKIILADLCPRFGKTIWVSAVAIEIEVPVVIISSYVKTVFTSFRNELSTYNQFSKSVFIDTGIHGYQNKIESALQDEKQVFAYLSLSNSRKRQEKIDFLFGIERERLLVVDEADFGSHRKNQALPLITKTKEDKDCRVIIMTGTNADRAASSWDIDEIVSVTYPELLIQKRKTQNAQNI